MVTDFKIGQSLYFVPNNKSNNTTEWWTVEKVGRKWLTCKRYNRECRVDKKTLNVDGGNYNSPGRCYLSKEEYDKQKYHKDLWESIKHKFDTYNLPNWATVDNLSKIKELIEK